MPEVQVGFSDGPAGAGYYQLMAKGPTMIVDIGFDPKYNSAAPSVPIAGERGIEALVDTGATESCIDTQLATKLNLPVIDRQPIGGIGGKMMANIYLAQLYIPALNYVIYGNFAGVELVAGGQIHKALIGRTFLRNFTMTYSGPTGDVKIFS